jgi:hypothetical protein
MSGCEGLKNRAGNWELGCSLVLGCLSKGHLHMIVGAWWSEHGRMGIW